MPLPLTVSYFSKIQIGFIFLVPAHLGRPGKMAIKQVCVCVTEELAGGTPKLTEGEIAELIFCMVYDGWYSSLDSV